MKKKLMDFIRLIVLSITCCTLVAYAGTNYGTFWFNPNDVTAFASAYVSFTEGPLVFQDKISYTLTLGGADRSMVGVPYRVDMGSINNNVETWTMLNYLGVNIIGELCAQNGYTVSQSDISVGYGHSGVRAILTLYDDDNIVIAR